MRSFSPDQAVDVEPTGTEQVGEHEHGVADLVLLRRLKHVVVVTEREHGVVGLH